MKRALVVVDVQRDFCEGGSLAVTGGNGVAVDVRRFLEQNRGTYDFIAFTRDWHITPGAHFASTTGNPEPDFTNTWPDHCIADTEGARFHRELEDMIVWADIQPDIIVSKGMGSAAYSGFEGVSVSVGGNFTTLEKEIAVRGINRVDIVGIAYDYCVLQTALDAARLDGVEVRVLKHLTASVNPDNDPQTGNALVEAGVDIVA